jgi:hypothetical protein
MHVYITGLEGLAQGRLHFGSGQLRSLICEKSMSRRNVMHHVTRNMQRATMRRAWKMVKKVIKCQQMVMTAIKSQQMRRRRLTRETLANCGSKASVMNHDNTTITWTSSPAYVPKEVEDQVNFLLSLCQEEEYVKLVELAADVNVS